MTRVSAPTPGIPVTRDARSMREFRPRAQG